MILSISTAWQAPLHFCTDLVNLHRILQDWFMTAFISIYIWNKLPDLSMADLINLTILKCPYFLATSRGVQQPWKTRWDLGLELVSKELNHFGVIADLFRQIGGHSSQGKIFLILRPKTRGNKFKKLAIWGTIFVGTELQQIA